MHLGVVDEDVDLAADFGSDFAHVLRIGDVERQQRHLWQCFELIESGELLPRLGVTNPDEIGTCRGERLCERLSDAGLAVGDEHLAELGIASELAQLSVFSHVALLRR